MKKMSMQEFKEKYRPQGYGEMEMRDGNGKLLEYSRIEEVICDVCNKEIIDDEPVFLEGSWAVCEECAERIGGDKDAD